jgi:hypothetical protein
MKNLNERRNREQDVVPFERRETGPSTTGSTLISNRQIQDLRERWMNIQASFVDEPKHSIEEADKLVMSAVQQVEETFKMQRTELERQWKSGGEASTEDLRICLQRYREFFDRLLSM